MLHSNILGLLKARDLTLGQEYNIPKMVEGPSANVPTPQKGQAPSASQGSSKSAASTVVIEVKDDRYVRDESGTKP